jgi:hypothetical protein
MSSPSHPRLAAIAKKKHAIQAIKSQVIKATPTGPTYSGHVISDLCKHCMLNHDIDPCMICDKTGHQPHDCPARCDKLIQCRPVICQKVHYDCLELSTGDDAGHVCQICAKVWQQIHIKAPTKRGLVIPHVACSCSGFHFKHFHTRLNCTYCTLERQKMARGGAVDFTAFNSRPCTHIMRS